MFFETENSVFGGRSQGDLLLLNTCRQAGIMQAAWIRDSRLQETLSWPSLGSVTLTETSFSGLRGTRMNMLLLGIGCRSKFSSGQGSMSVRST